jgi:hypothetical protein
VNFGALKVRAASLARLAGYEEVQPAPDWATIVNQALAEFSWEAEYCTGTATVTLVADTPTYTVAVGSGGEWKRFTDAVLGAGTRLYLTDENLLRRENPNWILAPAGDPSRFWVVSPGLVQFYPTPSSSGGVVTLRGRRADTPLSADTDAPTCAAVFHEGIALDAAWRVCKQFGDAAVQQRAAGYLAESKAYLDRLQETEGEEEAVALQRRVARATPERIALGWNRWIP